MDDATWLFDLKDVIAPPCVGDNHHGFGFHHEVKTCNDADFSRKLQKAGIQVRAVMSETAGNG